MDILRQTVPAMTVISEAWMNDLVVPEIGINEYQANLDIPMMVASGGEERTLDHVIELLHQAGLVLKTNVIVDDTISRQIVIASLATGV